MKKWISLFMVVLVLIYISNLQLFAFQIDGNKLITEGKKLFYEGKFKVAIEILNEALNSNLTSKKKIETHFYLGVCWIALNSIDNANRQFWEIIKIDPEYKIDIGKLPPEIKNIFEKAKEQFPVIYNFSAEPSIFHPYTTEKPSLKLMLTASDCINLSIKNNNQKILDQQKCFESPGINTFEWDWNDELLRSQEISLSLTPEKNKNEYLFERELKFDIEIPKNLLYKNNVFQIEGKSFLPEQMIKKVYPNMAKRSLYAIITGIAAALCLTSYSKESTNQKDSSRGMYIGLGVLCGISTIGNLITAFIPKKKKVSILENIEKNNQLKQEIQSMKEKIKVRQEVNNLN